jgi:hypothetical protein
MVEDLGSEDEIIDCLIGWGDMIRPGGFLILMLPDMQGGRYATVEEGGNVSHQGNVGKEFLKRINKRMPMYKMIQLDTVPHDKSCSIDGVFRRLP